MGIQISYLVLFFSFLPEVFFHYVAYTINILVLDSPNVFGGSPQGLTVSYNVTN